MQLITIFLPPVFGYGWAVSLYALGLFLLLWLRKLQDKAHQQRVWTEGGWADMQLSEWYGEAGGERERIGPDSLPLEDSG